MKQERGPSAAVTRGLVDRQGAVTDASLMEEIGWDLYDPLSATCNSIFCTARRNIQDEGGVTFHSVSSLL